MSIMRGDRVVLVKEYDKMKMVGATLEVGNITETAVILRKPADKVAVVAVDIDEFYTYFANEIKGWTPWTELIITNSQNIGWYRTNGKRVQVKTHNGVRAEATCNKDDQFSLYIGVNIAVARCNKKVINQTIGEINKHIKELNERLASMECASKQIDNDIKLLVKQVKPIDDTGAFQKQN